MGLCFSYLEAPVTDKVSSDEKNEKLICGASSMQGWRHSQEDAHNCILDFDQNASLFAVYDGHGGREVAEYCSKKLPDFIKETEAYKSGDYSKALVDAFLGFDATLLSPKVIEKLKAIAGLDKTQTDSEEENVSNLYEEAAMPIEKVIEKYAANLCNAQKKYTKKDEDEKMTSEVDNEPEPGMSGASTSSAIVESAVDAVSSTNEIGSMEKESAEAEAKVSSEAKATSENGGSGDCLPDTSSSAEAISSSKSEAKVEDGGGDRVNNGEVSSLTEDKRDVSSSSNVVENGEVSKKGKGKALVKPSQAKKSPINTRPKRSNSELYKKWLNYEEDSDDESEDEMDETFNAPNEDSSDSEGEVLNPAVVENSDSSDEEEEEEGENSESSDKDNDDDEDENEEEEEDDVYDYNRPGYESGCTAVVALLHGKELYVANAGDSRCVLCRNGKAVKMSLDHKPLNTTEFERIKKAGGYVNIEGRVDSGLNLSRAIGDHKYKQNKDLSNREQKITALPDIRTLTLNTEEDEFMVLACDGIWNSMTSQDVVNFVRSRLKEGREKLSEICEEMFDHCLAPDSRNDDNGCDNMTAIIVTFRQHSFKRYSDSPDQSEKRAKTESTVESQADTTK